MSLFSIFNIVNKSLILVFISSFLLTTINCFSKIIENATKDDEEDIESDYSGSCSLYNDKGEVALEIKDVHVNDLNGYICGNEHVGWTNLRTGEEMYLSLTDKITIQQLDIAS